MRQTSDRDNIFDTSSQLYAETITMKYLVLLAALVLTVRAGPTCKCEETSKVKTFAVDINERGTTFTQKVTLDHDNNWALFSIPQHNTVEQQDILYDYNTRLVASMPSAGGFCLIDAIPEDFLTLEQLEQGFTQVQDPKARVTKMQVSETYKRVLSEPVQERTSLGPKMAEFCANKPVFHVETMEFASGQGIIGHPSGNDTSPIPPPNMGGQSLATRADPCRPQGHMSLNCGAPAGWDCCARSDSCVYSYQCAPGSTNPYSPPTYTECTGLHGYHGMGWNCVPRC